MTAHDIRQLFLRSLAIAVATACVTVAAVQQPAQPPVDRVAQEQRAAQDRQAEIN